MKKHIKITDNIYQIESNLFIWDSTDVIAFIEKNFAWYDKPEIDSFYDWWQFVLQNWKVKVFCIFIESFDWSVWDLWVLVHECLHLALDILNYIWIEMWSNCEEALTYYQQFLFEWFLKELKK